MSRRPPRVSSPARRSRDDRGAVAVLTALVSVVLLVVAGLAVDIGNTWARRGQLQVQADRAATYAAQFLPADNDEEKLDLAKGVAFYFACHPVLGQRQLDSRIPGCPADPSSTTLDTYAAMLLESGRVTFPVRNQVKVVTPWARVDYGFGRVAGQEGSTQRKSATAKVTSPGMLSPMGLSLDCLLNAGANVLGGGGGLPFGYISTTHKGAGSPTVTTTWPSGIPTQNEPRLNGISPGRVTQQLLGQMPVVQVSGERFPVLSANQRYVVSFRRGTGLLAAQHEATGPLVLDSGNNPRRVGHVPVYLPAAVAATSGTWQVKVVIENLVAGVPVSRVYSSGTSTLDVDPLATPTTVSCGRLLKSPRGGTQANVNFEYNLQEGIDHLLTQHPSLISLGASLDHLDLAELTNLLNLLQCSGGDVKDTNGVQPPDIPSCVVTKMSNAYERGFTAGLIGPEGRLACKADHPCRPGKSFSLNGVVLNNDRFSDFVTNPSLLTADTFFNLDGYLDTSLPVVTPQSNLSRDIYGSHRFMWVAVISTTGATSAVQAGDYPIVTFRPIFITQSSVLDGSLPLLDSGLLSPLIPDIAAGLATVDATMRTLLQPGLTDHNGLMVDSSSELSSVRFMSISPEALPAVPADYTGPEAEYLGVGPRIIRLVE